MRTGRWSSRSSRRPGRPAGLPFRATPCSTCVTPRAGSAGTFVWISPSKSTSESNNQGPSPRRPPVRSHSPKGGEKVHLRRHDAGVDDAAEHQCDQATGVREQALLERQAAEVAAQGGVDRANAPKTQGILGGRVEVDKGAPKNEGQPRPCHGAIWHGSPFLRPLRRPA